MNNRGQALVEYVLIIALISLTAIAAVKFFGGILADKITETGCQISGQTYKAGEKKGEGKCVNSTELP